MMLLSLNMHFTVFCVCILFTPTNVTPLKVFKDESRNYRTKRSLSESVNKKMQQNTTDLPLNLKPKIIPVHNNTKSRETFNNSHNKAGLKILLSTEKDIELSTIAVESMDQITTTSQILTNDYIANKITTQNSSTNIKDDMKTTTKDSSINVSEVLGLFSSKTSTLPSHVDKITFNYQLTAEKPISSKNANSVNTTTLSSVFEENLIPPLPEHWPYEDENINSYDENYYRGRERHPRDDNSFENTNDSKEEKSQVKHPSRFTSSGNIPAHVQVANQEIYQTITAIGKAMIDEPMSSMSKEELSYVTMPHDRHWYLWEGFLERKSGDSLSNNYTDLTQIYWRGFGFGNRSQKGIWIMKVGCAASIFILVAAIASQSIKNRKKETPYKQKSLFITNLATCFIIGHLVFIFGIQATNLPWACGIVSLLLHFLHLLCCCWILALSIRLLRHLQRKKMIFSVIYCIPVWIATAATVVISFILNPSGYETKSFCWLSVEKGMLVSYIGPVCSLLLVNTGVCVACQKLLLDSVDSWDSVDRSDLKASVVLLPLEGIAWFLVVVALEDAFSYALDLAAAFCTIAVAFFILHYLALGGSNPVVLKIPCQTFEHPTDDDPSVLSIDDSTELALMQQVSSLSCPDIVVVDEYHETLFPYEQEEREVY